MPSLLFLVNDIGFREAADLKDNISCHYGFRLCQRSPGQSGIFLQSQLPHRAGVILILLEDTAGLRGQSAHEGESSLAMVADDDGSSHDAAATYCSKPMMKSEDSAITLMPARDIRRAIRLSPGGKARHAASIISYATHSRAAAVKSRKVLARQRASQMMLLRQLMGEADDGAMPPIGP